ncbi:hypothetical protein [Amphiplicatus metriothermophilus]|uniref:Uncharacterized protein n=1 Tax=Amphiplicatus metriothermophilus TaxID=1519374 RepID=A0A239PP31_9PROT|nr:hypothetical protein [Amphiplicatus metriothermophilus]MBB5518820.1 hypothetical protein [Amphiplicatus metriothermophilus]SNT72025.1 hypothetical protein SAMN06297382_1050 [Amphiplicatus metriothermophilus]
MAVISAPRHAEARPLADFAAFSAAALYIGIGLVAMAIALPAAFATAQAVPMFEECYEASCATP